MRPMPMSTLLVALPVLVALLAAGCQSNDNTETLTLRPPSEVGPQILRAAGRPAIEVTTGPAPTTITLVAADLPENASSHFVVRGKVKCNGVTGSEFFQLLTSNSSPSSSSITAQIHAPSQLQGEWRDFEIQCLQDGPTPKRLLLNLSLSGGNQVTVADPLVIAPLIQSGNQWVAQEPVGTVALRSPETIAPRVATVRGSGGEPAIEVAAGEYAVTYTLAFDEFPRIAAADYTLRGRVRYDNPTPGSYLELVSDFGPQGSFFTRSLGDAGLLKNLDGKSDWRDFALPFHAQPGMIPQQLALKVSLQAGGHVAVEGPLVITWYPTPSGWWSASQARWIGGILAAALCLLAGLVRLSAALKKPFLTASLCGAGLTISTCAIVAGLAALCDSQPPHVGYPSLVIGGIGLCLFAVNLRRVALRSQADELRRMTAADVV